MPKSSGAKRKAKNAGVGIDFKKAKHKVGKRLPKAQNATDTKFKSRSISLPSQTVGQDKGVAVSQRNLTLKEMLGQTSHYSPKVRLEALRGMQELFSHYPNELRRQAGPVIEKLAVRIADPEKTVRLALLELFQKCLVTNFDSRLLTPFIPLLMAHICSAMTHLQAGIRADAMAFLEAMITAAPGVITTSYTMPALQLYSSLLSPASRSRSISSHSLSSLLKTLTSLQSFLTKAGNSGRAREGRQDINENTRAAAEVLLVEHKCDWVSTADISQAATSLLQMRGQSSDGISSQAQVYQELLSNLLENWGECQANLSEETNLSEGLQAMETCLRVMHLLLQQESYQIGTGCRTNDATLQDIAKIHLRGLSIGTHLRARNLILRKVGSALPIKLMSSKAAMAIQQLLMQLNVAGMQLLSTFLDGNWQTSPGSDAAWLERLLEYYSFVLEHGEILAVEDQFMPTLKQPPIPTEIYCTILSGVKSVLHMLPEPRRRQLLQGVSSLGERCSSRSPTKIAILGFISTMFSSPGIYLTPSNGMEAAVSEVEAASWLKALPKLLWELGESRSEASYTALQILMNAARFATQGSQIAGQLIRIQGPLALFYCTEIPKAATPVKHPSNKSAPSANDGVQTVNSPERRVGVFSHLAKLPQHCQVLAIDLLYYLPSISDQLFKAFRLMCASSLFTTDILSRLAGVLTGRLDTAKEERAALVDFCISVLSHPARRLQSQGDLLFMVPTAKGLLKALRDEVCSPALAARILEWLITPTSNTTLLAALTIVSNLLEDRNVTSQPQRSASSTPGEAMEDSSLSVEPVDFHALETATPRALAEALVRREEYHGCRVWLLQLTEKLVLCKPELISPLLSAIPLAVQIIRELPSSDASEASYSGAVTQAAEAILYLCNHEKLRMSLAKCQRELQAAGQSLRQMAATIEQGTAEAQKCEAICIRLSGLTSGS